MPEEVAAPVFIDALGLGEAVSAGGALTGALAATPEVVAGISAADAAAGMGAADAAGWGGMTEGVSGLDALSSLAGVGGADPSWIGNLGLGTTPEAGGMAIPEMVDATPVFSPAQETAAMGQWAAEDPSLWNQMNSAIETVSNDPTVRALNRAHGVYGAVNSLDRLLHPPAIPQTVSGLRPQVSQQPQQWNPAFGRPLSTAIRGA